MIYLGNEKINPIHLGNAKIKEAYLGNTRVYSADKAIYKDGVLANGVTLTTFENHTSGADVYTGNNVLRYGHSQTSFTQGGKTGSIAFDFTHFSSIVVKGYSKGFARQGSTYCKLGIDSASDTVTSTFSEESFEKTFDVSQLSGNHTIASNVFVDNTSGDTSVVAYEYIAITEIMAYT